jgi:hypothetical protein
VTLTSVQQRTLDELMRCDPLPVFDAGLVEDVRADLERRLAPVLDAIPEGTALWVTKARLTKLHSQCEGLFLADHHGEGVFTFSERLAVGSLVHKAVEIGVYAPELSDAELVERAEEKLRRDDPRFEEFASLLDPADRAMVVAEAVDQVLLFRATFPPLERRWTPAVEPKLQVPLLGDRVVLSARPDLMLGGADPHEPMRARRLIVELKTGQDRPEHDDDLRFYALAATLRLGVPPFRVATVLLDDGRWRAQDVTPDLLESAVRRVGGAYARVADLLSDVEPRLRAGPWCAWCPRAEGCPEAAAARRPATAALDLP